MDQPLTTTSLPLGPKGPTVADLIVAGTNMGVTVTLRAGRLFLFGAEATAAEIDEAIAQACHAHVQGF